MISHGNRTALERGLLLGKYDISSPGNVGRSSASDIARRRSKISRSSGGLSEQSVFMARTLESPQVLPITLSHLRSMPESSSCPPVDLTGKTDNTNFRASYRPVRMPLIVETADSCTDGCSTHECSTLSCDDGCSVDDCEPDCVQSCAGTEQCNFQELTACPCEDPHCEDPICDQDYHQPDVICSSLEEGSDWPGFPPRPGSGMPISLAHPPHDCLWVMPGEQCNVSAPTMNALGQHILHDHIESQQIVTCPLKSCAEVLDVQQAARHMMQEHKRDIYVCLWKDCNELKFADEESLKRHYQLCHSNQLECHWAGCEVSHTDPSQLQTHVSQAHLHMGFHGLWQASPSSHPALHPHKSKTESIGSLLCGAESSSNFSGSYPSPFEAPNGSPYAGQSTAIANLNRLPSPTIPESSSLSNHTPAENHSRSSAETTRRCMWLTDSATGKCCEMEFQTGNDLQAHVDHQHVWNKATYSPKYTPICGWLDCKRKGKPVQSREKLRRHIFTHTGCTFPPSAIGRHL